MKEARRKGVNNRLFALILVCGIGCGALAFSAGLGVDRASQVAVGAAADAMCKGGKDAHCQCKKGIDKKTGKCGNVPGGGKIGCPCKDVTGGDEAASGKCAAVGKCQADKADGMMPMLPMIPMIPMMMPMMEMPQDPCMQPGAVTTPTSTATTSTATSTASTTPASDPNANRNPNCPPSSYGAQSSGNFWGSTWDAVNPFSSPDDTGSSGTGGTSNSTNPSVWKNLLSSLGISNDSGSTDGGGSGTSLSSTSTGGVTSQTGTKATSYSQTTDDFAKNGSTFSYQANPYTISPQAATLLEQLKVTLKKMLDIVKGMI